jgi:gliding motility-associated-like protein
MKSLRIVFNLLVSLVITVPLYAQTVDWAKLGRRNTDNNGIYATSVCIDNNDNVISGGYCNVLSTSSIEFDTESFTGFQTTAFVYHGYFVKYNNSGVVQWVRRIGNSSGEAQVRGLASDASGNIYVSGYFTQTCRFGCPNNGTCSGQGTAVTTAGGRDGFLAKYDAAGNFLWIELMTGSSSIQSERVKYSSNSNAIYVSGRFSGTSLFGSGASQTSLTSVGTGDDVFIAKYDLNGTLLWVRQGACQEWSYASSMTVDDLDNVYVGGHYANQIVFGSTTLNISGGNNSNPYVLKYNGSGTLQWARSYATSTWTDVRGIAVDQSNNVYFGGGFAGTLTIGSALVSDYGNTISYMAKLNSAGTVQWSKKTGTRPNSSGWSSVYAMDVNSQNDIYVFGMYEETCTFDGNTQSAIGDYDVWASTWDTNGNLGCMLTAAGSRSDYAKDIVVGPSGASYHAGDSYGYNSTYPTLTYTATWGTHVLYPNRTSTVTSKMTWGMETPGPIIGNTNVCEGDLGITYSVPNITGAVFTWTVPSGSTIASGQGTNQITVNFGSSSGQICVSAVGNCISSDETCINVTVSPSANATITAAGPFCDNDAPVTLSAVDAGGTWSGNGVNATTGVFDPSAAGTGTHTITYTISGACGDTDAISIVVNDSYDATITVVGPFCDNDAPVTLSAVDAGGTWSGNGVNATTGVFDPSAAGTGTHTITYTISGACGDSDAINIVVSDSYDATITAVGPFCDNDAPVTLSAVDAGGTWSGNGVNATTGVFDPSAAGTGTHTITYTISGACGDSDAINIVVNDSYDATITAVGPFCDNDAPVTLSAVDAGGIWSGNGVNATTGVFDPSAAGTGTHTITYTISGACGDSDAISIVVNDSYDATITAVGPFCDNDAPVTLSAVDAGGIWSGNGVNATTGVFDPSAAGTGTHTITYTISGACGDSDAINIVVNDSYDATITAVGPFCDNDAPVTLSAVDAGGTWSGNGVNATTGVFDPSAAGTGTHTITYTISGACGDSDAINIVVNDSYDATITAVGPFCDNDAPFTLSAVDAGGTWSGNGVNATTGVFDPSAAGTGTHTITYTISGACGDSDAISIVVNDSYDATITAAGPFCDNDAPVTLSAVDAGGTWSGNGVNATTGVFDPSAAGIGTHTITYTISGACGDSDAISIVVNDSYDATITPAGPFCDNDAPFTLSAVDAGGVWSGNGVFSNGVFNPTVAGIGTHQIIYTISGSCGDADTIDIVVVDSYDATITPAGPFCDNDAPVTLNAVDAGGTWSGNGVNVTNGIFDPFAAGTGTHTIIYTISGACGDADTIDIVVVDSYDATITPAGPFCDNDAPFTLSAVDAGGVWSGNGVFSNGVFNPSVAGTGTHQIIYTISGSCGDADTIDIIVNQSYDATITPAGPFCLSDLAVLLTVVDTGGTWSGTGVNSSGVFDPSSAGIGQHEIIYTISGICGDADTITIEVVDNYDATITAAGPFCDNESAVQLTAVDGGGSWTGTGVSSSGLFDPSAAGQGSHEIIYAIPDPCGDADTIDIIVNESPSLMLTATDESCTGAADGQILSSVSGGSIPYTYLWSTGAITQNLLDIGEGTYVLTVTDANGCIDEDSVELFDPLIACDSLDPHIVIPNIFSPNADGENDVLYVRGSGVETLLFIVYDRWGEKVFESSSLDNGWDGTYRGRAMDAAVFVYYIKARFINGEEQTLKGNVTLIR